MQTHTQTPSKQPHVEAVMVPHVNTFKGKSMIVLPSLRWCNFTEQPLNQSCEPKTQTQPGRILAHPPHSQGPNPARFCIFLSLSTLPSAFCLQHDHPGPSHDSLTAPAATARLVSSGSFCCLPTHLQFCSHYALLPPQGYAFKAQTLSFHKLWSHGQSFKSIFTPGSEQQEREDLDSWVPVSVRVPAPAQEQQQTERWWQGRQHRGDFRHLAPVIPKAELNPKFAKFQGILRYTVNPLDVSNEILFFLSNSNWLSSL